MSSSSVGANAWVRSQAPPLCGGSDPTTSSRWVGGGSGRILKIQPGVVTSGRGKALVHAVWEGLDFDLLFFFFFLGVKIFVVIKECEDWKE